jgi:hypothetical protein
MNTEEKLQFLKDEIDRLNAVQVGFSAMLAAVIATHQDRAALSRQIQGHRAALMGKNSPLQTPELRNLAIETIDWFSLDTPPKI